MRYLGGKARVAKHIAPILTAHASPGVAYWEPFLGGGSMAAAAVPAFERAILSDAMHDLILLWQAIADGWEPPREVSEDEYLALRLAPPSALRGFAGFGCSFGGKWFGGYARTGGRNYAAEAARGLVRRSAALRGAEFRCVSYSAAKPAPGDVVYCDPPYAGTTGYAGTAAFDHARFWATAERWSREGAHVYVSEFTAPAGWSPVWATQHRNDMRCTTARTDALYALD